jgi:hypothetical protein
MALLQAFLTTELERVKALISHALCVSDWDDAYRAKGAEGVSWYQPEPVMSLELTRLLDVQPSEPVIDIGGGASPLVDRLLRSGFSDLCVLDVSEVALDLCPTTAPPRRASAVHTRRRPRLAATALLRTVA